MALLRPALRSTAFGRRLSSGGPSIPLPQACSLEPNTARPGFGGGLGGWWESAPRPTPELRGQWAQDDKMGMSIPPRPCARQGGLVGPSNLPT